MSTQKTLDLQILTTDNAPETSRPVLEKTEKMYGFTPNLYGILANSPAAPGQRADRRGHEGPYSCKTLTR